MDETGHGPYWAALKGKWATSPHAVVEPVLASCFVHFFLKETIAALLTPLRPTRPFIVNWNAVLFFLVILCASGGLRNHYTFVCQHCAKRRRVSKSFFPSIFPHECSMPRALLILVQQQIPKYSRNLIHHQTLFRVGYLCSNQRVA